MYFRLIPQRADSQEGKRHVRTVPVKLRKTIKRQMRNIISLFGSDNVFVLSVDDKAKVPIGVAAVTKQAPRIMHVSYEIRLPDHDFVKATKHKLTPSINTPFFKSRSRNNLFWSNLHSDKKWKARF